MSGLVQISLASSILIWIEKKDITYFFIIDSCVYYFFQFQCGLISEDEKTHFRRVLPVFWAFPVEGPISITSRACKRSNDGPKDRKSPKKRVKPRRKWVFFILRNQSARKLKKVVHTYYFVYQKSLVLGYPILISTSLFYILILPST